MFKQVSTRGSNRRFTVVAIPARDEADRIGACIQALLSQHDLDHRRLAWDDVRIVVLANNCKDATAEVAGSTAGASRVQVLTTAFPAASANAGMARRTAMDAALRLLPPGEKGLICTTDADSRARPDWIARLWQAVDSGAQAVAGVVDFDPIEAFAQFPAARRREAAYSTLQAEIVAKVDPEPHNPWPNHIWAWGANLAVTAEAYDRVGGLPPAGVAEDRAFVDRLRYYDVPVRHCLKARVWTSARRQGRAPGGLASLVDDHQGDDKQPCDALLEPARAVYRRAAWRARLRPAFIDGIIPPRWASRLELPPRTLENAFNSLTFGAAWSKIEVASPPLVRRRLQSVELEGEIRLARRLLDKINGGELSDPDDRAVAASAGLWSFEAQGL